MTNRERGPFFPEKKSETLRDEKESLEAKFKKKTFSEKHIAEFQTREAPIRGSKYPEKMRSEVFRFERGQIVKAYKILREQIKAGEKKGEDVTQKKDLLNEIRGHARVLEKNLDTLERQYFENVKRVDIETEFGKFSVPVAELDLGKKENTETGEDKRIPYFFLGTVASNYHQTAELSMSLALEGKRVFALAWPEQSMVGRPENFKELLKKQQDLKLHAEYAKATIRSMGLDKVNIIGYSMGGTVALELMRDENFKEAQDLIVVEPAGLEDKGIMGIGKDLMIKEGLFKTVPYSETMIKTFRQGSKENTSGVDFLIEDGRILSKKQIDEAKLGEIMPKGRYQLWMGTKSSITNYETAEEMFLSAENIRKQKDPNANPIEIHVVKGGTHGWPCINGLGFSRLLDQEKPEAQVDTVDLLELENSGMARILKEIK